MNAIQAFLTRVFNLQKPLDRRLIWAGLGLAGVFGFLLFSGVGDSSSGTNVAVANHSGSKASGTGGAVARQAIYVHIVGFVRRPGLYRLDSGARVADAVFAAEGLTAKADSSSINLARVLTDGEQVIVAGSGSSGAIGGGIGTSGSGRAAAGQASLVNLNRADQSAIESLPGVGPTLASRIIDWRAANGGFKTKADLQKVAGIGDKLFAKLKNLVVL